MYLAQVVRGVAGTVRDILRAETPTHGALRDRLVGIVLISVVIDLICAGLALHFEQHVKQTDIQSYGSAFFWSTTQLLTVSSQIQNPFTVGGRILDVFMEAYAMIVVATLAGSMGTFLINRAQDAERAKRKADARSHGAGA